MARRRSTPKRGDDASGGKKPASSRGRRPRKRPAPERAAPEPSEASDEAVEEEAPAPAPKKRRGRDAGSAPKKKPAKAKKPPENKKVKKAKKAKAPVGPLSPKGVGYAWMRFVLGVLRVVRGGVRGAFLLACFIVLSTMLAFLLVHVGRDLERKIPAVQTGVADASSDIFAPLYDEIGDMVFEQYDPVAQMPPPPTNADGSPAPLTEDEQEAIKQAHKERQALIERIDSAVFEAARATTYWVLSAFIVICLVPRIRSIAAWSAAIGALVLIAHGGYIMAAGHLQTETLLENTGWEELIAGVVFLAGSLFIAVPLSYRLSDPVDRTFRRDMVEDDEDGAKEVRRIGPFIVEERLGLTDDGPVYAGHIIGDNRNGDARVDIRCFARDGFFEEYHRNRFRDAARLACDMTHPNVECGVEWGEEDGVHFVGVEHTDGETLHDRLRRSDDNRLPAAEVAAVTRDIAAALVYLAGRNVVYNQVRPDTVLVGDASAKLRSSVLADPPEAAWIGRSVIGAPDRAPYYLSPEQTLASQGSSPPIDWRSDQFNLGCVAWRALTGLLPWEDWTAGRVVAARVDGFLPHPKDVGVDAPDGLVAVLRRMLARSAAERYDHPDDMLDDLVLAAAGKEPKHAEVPTPLASCLAPPKSEIAAKAGALARLERTTRFSSAPLTVPATVVFLAVVAPPAVAQALKPPPPPEPVEEVDVEDVPSWMADLSEDAVDPSVNVIFEVQRAYFENAVDDGAAVAAARAEELAADRFLQPQRYERHRKMLEDMAAGYKQEFPFERDDFSDSRQAAERLSNVQPLGAAIAWIQRGLALFDQGERAPLMSAAALLLKMHGFESEAARYAKRAMADCREDPDETYYLQSALVFCEVHLASGDFDKVISGGMEAYNKARERGRAVIMGELAYFVGQAYQGLGHSPHLALDWYEKSTKTGAHRFSTRAKNMVESMADDSSTKPWRRKAPSAYEQMRIAGIARSRDDRLGAYKILVNQWKDTPHYQGDTDAWKFTMQTCARAQIKVAETYMDFPPDADGDEKRKLMVRGREALEDVVEWFYPVAKEACAEAQLALAATYLRRGFVDEKRALREYHAVIVGYPDIERLTEIAEFRIERMLSKDDKRAAALKDEDFDALEHLGGEPRGLREYYKELQAMPAEEFTPEPNERMTAPAIPRDENYVALKSPEKAMAAVEEKIEEKVESREDADADERVRRARERLERLRQR